MKVTEYIDSVSERLRADIISLGKRLEKLEEKVNAPKRVGGEKREEEKMRIIAREELQEDLEKLAWQIAGLNKKIESLSAAADEKKNTKKENTGKTEGGQ